MDLRARVAMAKATSSSEFYERQRALRQRLVVLKAELLPLAEPEDARDLAWFKPTIEQVRDERRRLW
jgi:hypothetical protein